VGRFRSKVAAIGIGLYLFIFFICAAVYPRFDRRTFSGLFAVLLAWPWIDYFPSSWFLVAIALNAAAIYVVLAVLSFLLGRLRNN
jgi:hypothetical protein